MSSASRPQGCHGRSAPASVPWCVRPSLPVAAAVRRSGTRAPAVRRSPARRALRVAFPRPPRAGRSRSGVSADGAAPPRRSAGPAAGGGAARAPSGSTPADRDGAMPGTAQRRGGRNPQPRASEQVTRAMALVQHRLRTAYCSWVRSKALLQGVSDDRKVRRLAVGCSSAHPTRCRT